MTSSEGPFSALPRTPSLNSTTACRSQQVDLSLGSAISLGLLVMHCRCILVVVCKTVTNPKDALRSAKPVQPQKRVGNTGLTTPDFSSVWQMSRSYVMEQYCLSALELCA